MKISPITKSQFIKIVKATIYVSLSATVDYLISITTGSEFGIFTPFINIVLVTIKQAFATSKA